MSYNAIQMGIELGILQAALLGMPGLWLDAINALGKLQSGETILPLGGIGADWMWNASKQVFERSAPGYQLIPKTSAHDWTVTFDGDSFTLVPALSRPSSQFKSAAAGGGADYLEGGTGDDSLYGGAGGDTYHFNLGDGEDHVFDSLAEGDNILSFGAGIEKTDLHVTEYTGGLRVEYGSQGDIILLPGAGEGDTVFRSVRLADGTVFDFSELLTANHAPEINEQATDQAGKQDEAFTYVIPTTLFTDPDGDELALNVTLADGSVLPSWLTFDAATRTLSGTPGNANVRELSLRMTASDGSGDTDWLFGGAGDDTLFASNDAKDIVRSA